MSSGHVCFLIYLLIIIIIMFSNLGINSGTSQPIYMHMLCLLLSTLYIIMSTFSFLPTGSSHKFLSSFYGDHKNHSAKMEYSEHALSTHRKLLFHGNDPIFFSFFSSNHTCPYRYISLWLVSSEICELFSCWKLTNFCEQGIVQVET